MSFPRYPEYRQSGEEWIGEVPADWQVLRLRFAASLNPSKQETSHLPPETLVTFLPMEAVGEDGSIDLSRERPLSEVLEGYTYLRDGDIAFAKITPCFENGKGALMRSLRDGIGFGTTELTVMRPREDRTVAEFLNYWIASRTFRQIGEAHMYGAGGQKRVPESMVRDFRVPLPSLPEQRAIAAFLDRETAKIDALVAEQRRLMDLLREKRQAVISHAVTKGLNPDAPMKDSGVEWLGDVPAHWSVQMIKRLSPVMRGASPRPIDDPKYFDDDGEFAWVRIADVSASTGRLTEASQYLSDLGSSLSVKLAPGALFVSIAGTVGKPCITDIHACIHDGFVYFPSLQIEPMWLFRIFEAGTCYGGLGKLGTQLNLNTDTIGSIVVPVPPANEAREILRVLERRLQMLDALREDVTASLSLLEERRAALVTAAVTGQIDVRAMAAAA
ncbi:restriction endonuclease subunit S [Gemmatimonas sp.]|uniref:restriction endonuclease subunit S n=1 Tax=Gemmatimonas sp. TaxID=1962908 RepID=UPI0025BC5FDA|nr:restriction endonuclease subunit S [Gemmatimonas sp.]MCA2993071.1 restriction endonuclease subunit S [Gemmatimonas sp.]